MTLLVVFDRVELRAYPQMQWVAPANSFPANKNRALLSPLAFLARRLIPFEQ